MTVNADSSDLFQIKVNYRGILKDAIVNVRYTGQCPQYRVAIHSHQHDEVYILYQINQQEKKFFWYPLSKGKEKIAVAITDALQKRQLENA